MDWKQIYKSRLTTAKEAVKKIKSGDPVVIAHATGEPVHVTDAMVADVYKRQVCGHYYDAVVQGKDIE